MYEIKIRKEGETSWEAVLNPSGYTYGLSDFTRTSGRTMDDVFHKSKTSQKVMYTLTFDDIDLEKCHKLLHAFSHQYVEILFFDLWENKEMVRHFVVGDRSTKAAAWNDTYKRFDPMVFELEER